MTTAPQFDAQKNRRHPSDYTDNELRAMLRVERLAVTQRLMAVKREVRERVAEMGALEQRLEQITASEDYLSEHGD